MAEEPRLVEVMDNLERFLKDRDWEKFHDPKNLAMSIAIESAELMELFQWLTTEQAVEQAGEEKLRARVREELADVLLYCLSLARVLDIDIYDAMARKIEKNTVKYPVETFKGIARKYTDPPASRVDRMAPKNNE